MPMTRGFDARLALLSGIPTRCAVNRIGTHLAACAMLRLLRGHG